MSGLGADVKINSFFMQLKHLKIYLKYLKSWINCNKFNKKSYNTNGLYGKEMSIRDIELLLLSHFCGWG